MSKKSISYKDSGVDIDMANDVVSDIARQVECNNGKKAAENIGAFGACVPLEGYKNPVLVSCADGVGTKIKLAIKEKQHKGIGIDLVAMCVNDLIVQGATPLYFLDYIGMSDISRDTIKCIINGIIEGCNQASYEGKQCILVGGETAQMPEFYASGQYDVAGFAVGVVEKERLINPKKIRKGDLIIGLKSNGIHSNGFSAVNKYLENTPLPQDISIEDILLPTRIYVKTILEFLKKYTPSDTAKTVEVHGIAHITGGGLIENILRILPKTCNAVIKDLHFVNEDPKLNSIFSWLWENIKDPNNLEESYINMYRTFNCGIGMVLIVSVSFDPEKRKKEEQEILSTLQIKGDKAYTIGYIASDEEFDKYITEKDANKVIYKVKDKDNKITLPKFSCAKK